MPHSPFRSGVIAALGIALLATVFFILGGTTNSLPPSVVIHIASSTIPTNISTKNSVATSTPTTSVPKKVVVKKITSPASAPVTTTQPTQSSDEINAELNV